ncbi:MAG: Ig-like domain-containing protein, partial [Paracoccaceae bacterium]
MVTAIDFAVRGFAGGRQLGTVAGEGQANYIQIESGDSVSLNISPSSVVAYEQQGRDLVITLADGRVIVLSGYFDASGSTGHLYLSASDQITEVMLSGDGNGVLMAQYGPAQPSEKWSPLDDLRFTQADDVVDGAAVTDEPAGMGLFAPAMLGGLGGIGAAGVGLVGLGVVAGGGGSTTPGGGGTDTTPGGGGGTDTTPGGGGNDRVPPTVNDPDNKDALTTNTTNPVIEITGTGEPGDSVVVTVGDRTQTTVIGSDSTWGADFEGDDLPADGSYSSVVVVTEPGGTEHVLDGPDYVIDMTPPAVAVTTGTESVGHIENLADYADGITIAGEGEAGAAVRIEVGGLTRDSMIDAQGHWSFNFGQSEIAGGERTLDIKVTATDPLGNSTVITDKLVIDTVPHPVSIDPVTDNNLVNEAEHDTGFTMTGSTSPNTTVILVVEGGGATVSRTITSDASGNWQQEFPLGTLPAGTYQAAATLSTVDGAGNASSVTRSFDVDTEIGVTIDANQAGDNVISGSERLAGITLTGTAHADATLSITFNGVTHENVRPNADGIWTLPVDTAGIPSGTTTATVSVTAVDSSGNSASASHVVNIDTEVVPLTRDTMSNGS